MDKNTKSQAEIKEENIQQSDDALPEKTQNAISNIKNEKLEKNSSKAAQKKRRAKTKTSFYKKYLHWPLIALGISLIISFMFSAVSEFALKDTTLIVAISVIVVLIIISVLTDIAAVAVTAVDIKPFRSMSAKKVSGAKEAIILIKNADKVASIFADIIGDVCAILSGASGVVVTNYCIAGIVSKPAEILIAAAVSAVIAGVIISGKALGKKFAINKCAAVVLILGKIVKFLTFNKLGNKKNNNKKKQSI